MPQLHYVHRFLDDEKIEVGTFNSDGNWISDGIHDSMREAQDRISFLNTNGRCIRGVDYSFEDLLKIPEIDKHGDFFFSKCKGGWSTPRYPKSNYFRFETIIDLLRFAIYNGEYAKINDKMVSYYGSYRPFRENGVRKWKFTQGNIKNELSI
jgi:hypothetical protein